MPSISEVKASFILLALALVIGPLGMYKGSLLEPSYGAMFPTFPISSKGFILESSPTSKRDKSETLKVALYWLFGSQS